MRKKKRRLRLPFRILRTLFILTLLICTMMYLIYQFYFKDDVAKIKKTYNDIIFNDEDAIDKKITDSSYTIAIIGVDEDLKYGRADSINLLTVNGKTDDMQMYSVPRDTYINYSCIDNMKDKITNSHSYGGTDCLMSALGNLFEIEVDFYIKMDFDGFISIISQLGTITTEVPDFNNGSQWCEQMADRETTICFTEFGTQQVNAEQALSIARSRQYSSDLDRGNLQVQIIQDTILELSKLRDLGKVNEIISSTDGNFETNISIEQATAMAYNYYKFKNTENEINSNQIPGVAEYTWGEYVGYGSYFLIDEESWNVMKNQLKEFLN